MGAQDSAALEREALAWLVRITDEDATAAERAALAAWQSQSPAHAAALERARGLWGALPPAIDGLLRSGALQPDGFVHRPAPRIGRRAFLGGAAAATAAAACYLVVRPPLELWPSLSELAADYRTGVGQRRDIVIADAVPVAMNTQTSIVLRPAMPGLDRFELIAGEAAIDATMLKGKAVRVIAGDGSATATAANFSVRCDGPATSVTCVAGNVRVAVADQEVMLGAGQQVVYRRGGLGAVTAVDPTVVTAWRSGYLMFRKEPLDRVIAEVNRYRPGRIVLLDATLGRGLVTARFKLDRLDDVMIQVHEVFGARVRNLPGGVVLIG
ncbi:FecR family protein [Bradyrhizobium sp. 2TAF24]|uniref:FecR family protein n=1 Tax=Bradyrhizobium sp. 2TAF24 TaxID=3233011 RepID=UPI003F9301B6